MKTDWFKLAAIALICGGFIGMLLLILFPDVIRADTSGPVHEIYLSDHTRCAVTVNGNRYEGISCDWERRYK